MKPNHILKLSYLIVLFIGFHAPLSSVFAQTADIKPVNLNTEYKQNPIIDTETPRLSWELTSTLRNQNQKAYQIMVASKMELLKEGKADLWNSKKINSAETNQIEYSGKTLTKGTVCYWKVRTWDKNNVAGQWSKIARWERGL